MFVPIEIKSKAHITAADARGIRAFRKTYPNIRQAAGCVVASVEEVFELPDRVMVLPYDIQ